VQLYQYVKDKTLPQRTHLAVTQLTMTPQHTTMVFSGFAHIVLPCLGVACCLHLEGDNLLHMDSDNLEQEKCRCCNMVCRNFGQLEHLKTTGFKTCTLFLLLQMWLAKIAWKLPIQRTHFLLQITCASTWTRLSPWTWQQNILLKCWNTTSLCGLQLMTIIWKIGKKCENQMWKVKVTTDSSCLTN